MRSIELRSSLVTKVLSLLLMLLLVVVATGKLLGEVDELIHVVFTCLILWVVGRSMSVRVRTTRRIVEG